MAKFCGSCGAQLDDSAKVCGKCGTPLGGNALNGVKNMAAKVPGLDKVTSKVTSADKQTLKKYGILGGAAIAALIVVIIIISTIVNSTGTNGLTKKYMKVLKDGDGDAYFEMLSSYWEDRADYEKDEDYEDNKIDTFENYAEMFDEYFKEECGSKYKIKYEIVDSEVLEGRSLDRVIERYEIKEGKKTKVDPLDSFSKVKEVEIDVIGKGKKGEEDITLKLLYVKDTKGGWKILAVEYDEDIYEYND